MGQDVPSDKLTKFESRSDPRYGRIVAFIEKETIEATQRQPVIGKELVEPDYGHGMRILSLGKSPDMPLKSYGLMTLDGGGVRGLSSLLILKDLMYHIQQQRNLKDLPRPCEYFDMICGTSTGG